MTRLKSAELTSGVGALVLDVGLGAVVPDWFASTAGFIVLAGVVVQGYGDMNFSPVALSVGTGESKPDAASVRSGLSSTEAQRRLSEFGPNEIRREESQSALALFARQLESPVIWLLVGASVLSAALGELLDGGVIGAIVIVNAVIGFLQEHRAERAVMALRSMTWVPLYNVLSARGDR